VTDDKTAPTGDDDEPTAEESAAAVEVTEASEPEEPADLGDATNDVRVAKRRNGIGSSVLSGARRSLGVILVTAALVISAGLAAWSYYFIYRPDQQTNAAAANVALDAAKSGTVALLSYSPDTLDKDFAAAKSHLTGDFLSYYTQFTQQIVTPAAKEKQVKTTASVVRAGVSELHPQSAVVLVFINQVTTSKENPDGAFAASSVKVSLTKSDGRWLINAFDPV
jgi:Mce-associated membrane protein